ncbi:MAG: class I SAM-dependent methyltransferase [Oligoflexia bacterium]|nr:class I SAM-dependent methyltransferase [Oligoflexia bacterium]
MSDLSRDSKYSLDHLVSSSNVLDEFLEEFNEDHFFEKYNRELVFNLINFKEQVKKIEINYLDLLDCHFKDNSFDIITCMNVFEHISDDIEAMKQIKRILRDDGTAVITVPACKALYDCFDEILGHFRRYDLEDLIALAQKAELKVISANYFITLIHPLFWARKKLNQILYSKKSWQQKKKITFQLAKKSGNIFLLKWICAFEQRVEKYISLRLRYPFGVRCYIQVRK